MIRRERKISARTGARRKRKGARGDVAKEDDDDDEREVEGGGKNKKK